MHSGGWAAAGAAFGRTAPKAGRDGVFRAVHATAEPLIATLFTFGSASAAARGQCVRLEATQAGRGLPDSPSKGVMRRLRAAGVGSTPLCSFQSARYWAASSAVVNVPGRGFCPPPSRPFFETWSCAW